MSLLEKQPGKWVLAISMIERSRAARGQKRNTGQVDREGQQGCGLCGQHHPHKGGQSHPLEPCLRAFEAKETRAILVPCGWLWAYLPSSSPGLFTLILSDTVPTGGCPLGILQRSTS